MTYAEVTERLGIERVCFGGCGLNEHRHRGSLFLGVIHWRERRMSKRGLRRFLLLAARREREADPGFLNSRSLGWLHAYYDERRANDLAARLSVRFPVDFSRAVRIKCWSRAPEGFWQTHQAIHAWAIQGHWG